MHYRLDLLMRLDNSALVHRLAFGFFLALGEALPGNVIATVMNPQSDRCAMTGKSHQTALPRASYCRGA